MQKLEDVVSMVVKSFIQTDTLFTALDVSNKVKETFPFARHKDVSTEVRNLFNSTIQPAGWAKTQITVTLADGSSAEAFLYHSLADSWDLDNKYNDQKRSQTTVKNNPMSKTTPLVSATVPVSTPLNSSVSLNPTHSNMKDLWNQMFQSQPSLFPRKL